MIKKTFFLFLTLAFLTTGFIIYQFFFFSKEVTDLYKSLSEQKKDISKQNQNICQNREQIQKDIWVSEKNQRHHFRIYSNQSTLSLTQKNNKIDCIEHLTDLQCWIQDQIDYKNQIPVQQIRYLTAKHGTYEFLSHHFWTEKIAMSFYIQPGNELPETLDIKDAYLKGFAEEVSFRLASKIPSFKAYHFTATFTPNKGKVL